MNKIDRDRLRELEKLATPTPWYYNSYSDVHTTAFREAHDKFYADWCAAGQPHFGKDARNEWWDRYCATDSDVCHVPADHGDTAIGRHSNDAELIEEMRNNLLALLDEVDRLEQQVQWARDAVRTSHHRGMCPHCWKPVTKPSADHPYGFTPVTTPDKMEFGPVEVLLMTCGSCGQEWGETPDKNCNEFVDGVRCGHSRGHDGPHRTRAWMTELCKSLEKGDNK